MDAPSVNIDLLRSRAEDIRREVQELRGYGSLPLKEFVGSSEKVRAARYALVVVAEAASAICNHLVSRRGRAPESYPACFELMADLDILDSGLAGRLIGLARLRNILVHGYGRVDDARVHAHLKDGLRDLDAFLGQVAAYLGFTSDELGAV